MVRDFEETPAWVGRKVDKGRSETYKVCHILISMKERSWLHLDYLILIINIGHGYRLYFALYHVGINNTEMNMFAR